MGKKTYIQILLFSILSILIILTFNFYKPDKIEIKNKKTQSYDREKSLEKTESFKERLTVCITVNFKLISVNICFL